MGGTDGIVHNNEGQVLRRQALCCDNEVSYQRSDDDDEVFRNTNS